NRYTLTLSADGTWTAVFVRPPPVTVDLGTSGSSVEIRRTENGSYRSGGERLESGAVLLSENGGQYQLTLEHDGTWTAAYQSQVQDVPLGLSGFVTISRDQDGTWSSAGKQVEDGGTLLADTGSSYRMRFRNGYWAARFIPEEAKIAGTPLVATWREDRRGYRVGTSALLPRNGKGDVTVDGKSYHVWKVDGDLKGPRFDNDPHGQNANQANFLIGRTTDVAALNADNNRTAANEGQTLLRVGGGRFPVEEVLDHGQSVWTSRNLVATALTEIETLRSNSEVLLEQFADEEPFLRATLNGFWEKAQRALNPIFGAQRVSLPRLGTEDEVLEDYDSLIQALSSLERFVAATRGGGGGVFEGAALSEAAAREVFDASASESEVIFGVSGGTRYGAFITRARRAGRAINPVEFDPDDSEFGAFAYSTIPDTVLTASIPTRGIASYSGGTAAVAGDGTFYRGSIELQVYFAGSRVSGVITDLEDKDGEPWVYVGFPVQAIVFPDARLEHDADWRDRVDRAERAGIRYQSRFLRVTPVRSRFEGHLLGLGEDAASQAVGVWSVGARTDGADYIA
ncbi:MAG: hypothetical protein OXG35_15045, partial [Acidobacteria bacterium]|nr:hypothetical protein [Acidobacteriota bacterium]